MGGFHERLVGCNKLAVWKSIRNKYFTQLQLQIFLSEIEAELNWRAFVYIGDDLNDGIIITPSHFLTLNTKTGTPTVKEETKANDSQIIIWTIHPWKKHMEKKTTNFKFLLESTQRWLPAKPSTKIKAETKITKDRGIWNTNSRGHHAIERRFTLSILEDEEESRTDSKQRWKDKSRENIARDEKHSELIPESTISIQIKQRKWGCNKWWYEKE